MNLFDGIWSYCSVIGVFVFGLMVAVYFSIKHSIDLNKMLLMYSWHTIFSILYLFFVIDRNEDAVIYYNTSLQYSSEIGLGTSFVVFFTRIFSYHAEMSILGVFLVYNIIGFIGLALYYVAVRNLLDKSSQWRFLCLIVYLPSINFWSGAIGKDAFSFLATILVLWACLDKPKKLYYLSGAIILMALVRPHVSAMIFAAYVAQYILNPANRSSSKILIVIFCMILSLSLSSFLMGYVGFGVDYGDESLDDYIERKQNSNMVGGGGIDTSSMLMPVKFFTYLFRPLPFDIGSTSDIFPAFDNLVQFFIVAAGAYSWIYWNKINKIPSEITFLWIYVTLNTFVLSAAMSNYGIALRQKWMVMPILLYLAIAGIVGKKAV